MNPEVFLYNTALSGQPLCLAGLALLRLSLAEYNSFTSCNKLGNVVINKEFKKTYNVLE